MIELINGNKEMESIEDNKSWKDVKQSKCKWIGVKNNIFVDIIDKSSVGLLLRS
jgi:hypothetical protein